MYQSVEIFFSGYISHDDSPLLNRLVNLSNAAPGTSVLMTS